MNALITSPKLFAIHRVQLVIFQIIEYFTTGALDDDQRLPINLHPIRIPVLHPTGSLLWCLESCLGGTRQPTTVSADRTLFHRSPHLPDFSNPLNRQRFEEGVFATKSSHAIVVYSIRFHHIPSDSIRFLNGLSSVSSLFLLIVVCQ